MHGLISGEFLHVSETKKCMIWDLQATVATIAAGHATGKKRILRSG